MEEQKFYSPQNASVPTRRSLLWVGILAVVLIIGGGLYYTRTHTPAPEADVAKLNTLYIKDKNFAAAEALAVEMDKKYPNNVSIKLIKGQAEASLKKYDEAVVTFNEVLALDPTNETALYYKDVIPKTRDILNAPKDTTQYSNTTVSVIESRLGVKFDPAILKFDSGFILSKSTNSAESLDATYESAKSVNDVALYLGKILPQPLTFISNGNIMGFRKTATSTDPSSYSINIVEMDGKTTVNIVYSKGK